MLGATEPIEAANDAGVADDVVGAGRSPRVSVAARATPPAGARPPTRRRTTATAASRALGSCGSHVAHVMTSTNGLAIAASDQSKITIRSPTSCTLPGWKSPCTSTSGSPSCSTMRHSVDEPVDDPPGAGAVDRQPLTEHRIVEHVGELARDLDQRHARAHPAASRSCSRPPRSLQLREVVERCTVSVLVGRIVAGQVLEQQPTFARLRRHDASVSHPEQLGDERGHRRLAAEVVEHAP